MWYILFFTFQLLPNHLLTPLQTIDNKQETKTATTHEKF